MLESWGANVFARLPGGALVTPPLDGRILPGVGRARLLAVHTGAREERLTLDALLAAEEVYLTSALGVQVASRTPVASSPSSSTPSADAVDHEHREVVAGHVAQQPCDRHVRGDEGDRRWPPASIPTPRRWRSCRTRWRPGAGVAAPSAGMARKKDSRVTATRSIPRSRPADIVAPERETPGISARHCTRPMMSVSLTRHVVLVALLGRVHVGVVHHAAPQDQREGHEPQGAQRGLDLVLEGQAHDRRWGCSPPRRRCRSGSRACRARGRRSRPAASARRMRITSSRK